MQLERAWPELRNLSLDVLLPLLPAAAKSVTKAPKNGEIDIAVRVAEWNAAGCAEKDAEGVLSACIGLLLPSFAAQGSLSFSVDSSLRQEQRFAVSLLAWCASRIKEAVLTHRITSLWTDHDIRHMPAIFLLTRSLYGEPSKRAAPAAPFFVFLDKMLREEATFGLATHALAPCLPPVKGSERLELCKLAHDLRQRGDAVHLLFVAHDWLVSDDFKLPSWILDAVAERLTDSRTFMRKEAAALLQLLSASPAHVADNAALTVWDSEQWALYFSLLASLEEAAAHLLAPLWPRRASLLLNGDTERWFVALILRGLQHQHGLVRRMAVEAVLTTPLSTDSVDAPSLAALPDLMPEGIQSALGSFLARVSPARRDKALRVCTSHLANIAGQPLWMHALASVMQPYAAAAGAPFLTALIPATTRIGALLSPQPELLSVLASLSISAAESALAGQTSLTSSVSSVLNDLASALEPLYCAGTRISASITLSPSLMLSHLLDAVKRGAITGLNALYPSLSVEIRASFFASLEELPPSILTVAAAHIADHGPLPATLHTRVTDSLPARTAEAADAQELDAISRLVVRLRLPSAQRVVVATAAANELLHSPADVQRAEALQGVWLTAADTADERLLPVLCTATKWGPVRFAVAARLLALRAAISVPQREELKGAALAVVDSGDAAAMPHVCEYLAAVLFSGSQTEEVEEIVDRVWLAWKDAKRKPARSAAAVFAFILHPFCWRTESKSGGQPLALRHWREALDFASRSPRTAAALVAAACAAWSSDLVLTAQRFLPCVVDAALLPHSEMTTERTEEDDGHKSGALLFGTWLANMQRSDATKFACALAEALLSAMCSEPLSEREYSPAAAANARKVSLWRALCVLSPMLAGAEKVHEGMWPALRLKNHPNVRQLMQLFMASVLVVSPRWAQTDLLAKLRDPNHEYQYAASLVMIAADVIAWLPAAEAALSMQLFEALIPLTLHFHHAVRVAAQTVVHNTLASREELRKSSPILMAMFDFLDGNKELTKLRVATMRGSTDTAPPLARTRVAALYAREDVELLEWAKRAVRAFQSTLSGPQEPEEGAAEEKEKGDKSDFQRRRTEPGWAAAARALEERVASGGGRGRARRFPAVVVGSLLDNVPNVAGLARSCEIFGVAQLCIPNKKVLTEAAFQRMSVSAEHHLPMAEVKPKNLPAFLDDMRRQGYTIIGIEQTANSHSLHTYRFPQRCVFVLGTEQEGLPASLVPLMDACVEIPQYGRLRSLNAHVSASLILFEYAKQHAADV